MLALSLLPVAAFAIASTPTIVRAGHMVSLPQAAYQPDRAAICKVVFNLSRGATQPGQINPGLERVARTIKLYTNAGVPLDHPKFVTIASGGATTAMLNDAQYQKHYDVANPNLAVIAELRKAGVDVAVCGQAVAEHHYENSWLDEHVTLALSALATVTELEQKGCALLPL